MSKNNTKLYFTAHNYIFRAHFMQYNGTCSFRDKWFKKI